MTGKNKTMEKYNRLFEPVKIGRLKLKNRILMPAIHMMLNIDGDANDAFKEFYYRRAEGGVGLVFVGGCRFDEYGGSPGMMSLEKDEFIPGYKEFTDGMHERGAKVGVQLYHAGAYAHSFANEGRQALAPSEKFSKFTKEMPKEMTKDEMHTIISRWAEGALRAKKAGFDIVEISGSAGYLICQFLSPLTNMRTDEYGGSWENRIRFSKEVVAAIRKAVGDDYPICIRIAGNDFVPNSNTNEDAVAFAKVMEDAGVDMINVTGGWHETVIPQLTGEVSRGGFSYLAAAVRDNVSIPVAASNRINDPYVAEKILATGEADLVSIGRPLIADPDWVLKAQEGRSNEIRKCIACNQGCLAKTFFAQPAGCIINAFAGHESELHIKKAAETKKILVVGAGVAGCEFAYRAAQSGHKVTIWEKSDKIGGQINIAAVPPSKHEFLNLIQYYEAMLNKYGVKLELSKNATSEEIMGAGYDLVVTATGNASKKIELPGCKSIPVYTPDDILNGEVIIGKNVVFVGGGSVACECADYLAREGAITPEQVYFMLSQRAETPDKVLAMLDKTRRNISIVDIAKIGARFEPGTAWPLMKELKRFNVGQYSYAKILDVTENSVEIEAPVPKTREQKKKERETGVKVPTVIEKYSLPCEAIIMSVGSTPNNVLYDKLRAKNIEVYNIGDSNSVGKISDAISSAIELLNKL